MKIFFKLIAVLFICTAIFFIYYDTSLSYNTTKESLLITVHYPLFTTVCFIAFSIIGYICYIVDPIPVKPSPFKDRVI